ncbi:MAG: hypothetical protein GXO75_12165 [Calditrichaeota bacterium]|nr:hypothetical protein [Calditrichota bacterium]
MKIFYDQEGDILEVQFTLGEPDKRTGISLSEQITVFCDSTFQNALGFTALAYSKLLSLPESDLDELSLAPKNIQDKIKKLISCSPLNRFLNVTSDKIGLEDVRISELVMH